MQYFEFICKKEKNILKIHGNVLGDFLCQIDEFNLM